ncbi:hypothetical protein [Sinorhizobium medicae]|uniref:hypothetical protein n=1 Tax=Sinorhizobium medicae TaxID=110321 RepID=UPI00041B3912|nr:hypothetical protein [Sinorhizobium medicae]RVQ76134.1 hypothetical protein CN244_06395 [Sinorhizobium medicae]
MKSPAPLPLLTWQEDAAIARLRAERAELYRRISALPVMSHRRVALSERLKELTARELKLELGGTRGRNEV